MKAMCFCLRQELVPRSGDFLLTSFLFLIHINTFSVSSVSPSAPSACFRLIDTHKNQSLLAIDQLHKGIRSQHEQLHILEHGLRNYISFESDLLLAIGMARDISSQLICSSDILHTASGQRL